MTTTCPAAVAGEITAMAGSLYRRGWMPGTAGNVSVRDGNDRALITGSGRSKGELTARDVVPVRIADSVGLDVDGVRPSAETTIHTAVYRATHSDAVVHVHAPFATAASVRFGRPDTLVTMPFQDYELLKGFGLTDASRCAVPIFPNWAEVARIARDVEAHLTGGPGERPPVLLIAGHGATSWGRDLAQARDRLECLEALCELLFLTGRPHPWRPEPPVHATTTGE
jgi:methylthioribose-1-phosphate isomerase